MISKDSATKFIGKQVFLLIDGKFYRGYILSVNDEDLILRFKDAEQVWSLSDIVSIREVED